MCKQAARRFGQGSFDEIFRGDNIGWGGHSGAARRQCSREPGQRDYRALIKRQRPLELRNRRDTVFCCCGPHHQRPPAQNEVQQPWMVDHASRIRRHHCRPKCGRDASGNFVLEAEAVAGATVETICPQICGCLGVAQLRGNANPIACPFDAAFEDVADSQLATDGSRIRRLLAVGRGGAACDHGYLLGARQIRR